MGDARIQKFIALSGYCSRRKAEELIEKGLVKVNGKRSKLGDKCLIEDEIEVEGKKLNLKNVEKKYIILNKPSGYLTTTDQNQIETIGRKTVFDLIKEKDKSLFYVGRLDFNTKGLLIITNDGEFSQQIIHPSKKIGKTYEIKLKSVLKNEHKKKIEEGLILDGHKLSKCKIQKLGGLYEITIYEGRKRQIRRVFETFGYKINYLKRISIGGLRLEDLNIIEGKYKYFKEDFLLDKILN